MKKKKRLKHPLPRVFLEPGTPAKPAFTWEKWTSREKRLSEDRQNERCIGIMWDGFRSSYMFHGAPMASKDKRD